MVLLKRRTGSLEAKSQGNGGGHGKLAGVAGWIVRRIRRSVSAVSAPLILRVFYFGRSLQKDR